MGSCSSSLGHRAAQLPLSTELALLYGPHSTRNLPGDLLCISLLHP